MLDLIFSYFPDLNETQKNQILRLKELYEDWNSKINVISRKDMDQFYIHHVLHSLTIANYFHFRKDSLVLDIGTGGGFPGIPLAIFFPEVNFHLTDSIGKKITVVNAVSEELGLKNVKGEKLRSEESTLKYDHIVTRAVAPLKELLTWSKAKFKLIKYSEENPALIALKGGDLDEEIMDALNLFPKYNCKLINLNKDFKEEFFETKKIVIVY